MVLTVVTGMVDAVSYLGLGRTFVANMTGNIVFLGFALAGASGLSAVASSVALGAFVTGSALGGRITRRLGAPSDRWLLPTLVLETGLIALAAAAAIGLDAGSEDGRRFGVVALLALAMGTRNAVVKGLAVPDLTTTVLTMTVTGLASDTPPGGGAGTSW